MRRILACALLSFGSSLCFAQASTATICGNEEIGRLTADQVTISTVDSGIFRDAKLYAIPCGPWSAQAFLRKPPGVALEVRGKEGEPIPSVPAQAAFRLYRLPLGRLLTDQPSPQAYGVTVLGYPELGDRLANAAAHSDGWNSQLGRPRSDTSINRFVKDLLNQQRLYSELATLAAQFDYEVRVSGVEKVELCPEPSSSAEPSHRGKVPCGAMVTFRMTPKGKANGERAAQK